jgi:hypothetical protein
LWRRRDDRILRQRRRRVRGAQSLGRRRSWHFIHGEQIRDRRRRYRQLEIGRIDHFLRDGISTRHTNGLAAVEGFFTSSTPRLARLRTAEILGLRKLVPREINHVILCR